MVVYPVLSFDHGLFVAAERHRAGIQRNETQALRVERLKRDGGCGVWWCELVILVCRQAVSGFKLCLCKRENQKKWSTLTWHVFISQCCCIHYSPFLKRFPPGSIRVFWFSLILIFVILKSVDTEAQTHSGPDTDYTKLIKGSQ